jgi:hypothetical protein
MIMILGPYTQKYSCVYRQRLDNTPTYGIQNRNQYSGELKGWITMRGVVIDDLQEAIATNDLEYIAEGFTLINDQEKFDKLKVLA